MLIVSSNGEIVDIDGREARAVRACFEAGCAPSLVYSDHLRNWDTSRDYYTYDLVWCLFGSGAWEAEMSAFIGYLTALGCPVVASGDGAPVEGVSSSYSHFFSDSQVTNLLKLREHDYQMEAYS